MTTSERPQISVEIPRSLSLKVWSCPYLYGCETWKLTKTEEKRIGPFRPEVSEGFTRSDGAAYPKQDRTGDDRDRKHQWQGGGTGLTTCFVDPTDNCVVAVGWTPKGEKRGRSKTTWRHHRG